VKTVGEILADTRRRIYLVLADGAPSTDETETDETETDDTESEPAS
jgi:hypothetical protein